MKGWTVVAVVALQAVAQTTAMALQSERAAEESGSASRRLSGEGGTETKRMVRRSDGSSSVGMQEDKVFVMKSMAEESTGVRCHMGNGGNDCLVKRESRDEPSISTVLIEGKILTMNENIDEEGVPSISNRKKRASEEISVEASLEDSPSPIEFEGKDTLGLARINNAGGHQPPTVQSKLARDPEESYVRKSVTKEDRTSTRAKSLEEGKSESKATKEFSEDQPSAETRGLLGGLLGGGGSGGNCTAQGETCSGGTCCPDLLCVDVELVGLSLCL